MFYHIEGTVAELEPALAVIDCGGVGYALSITMNTASNLHIGAKVKLYVAESIGETNFDLFGFYTKSEKRCFDMLISVSGIGPKAALSILSYNTPENLALAIMNGNEKALTVAPGIGKKIAQRVILELKDKISKDSEIQSVSASSFTMPVSAADSNVNDAIAALNVLGYTGAEIAPAMKKLDTASMSAEQIIRAVLKQMVR